MALEAIEVEMEMALEAIEVENGDDLCMQSVGGVVRAPQTAKPQTPAP